MHPNRTELARLITERLASEYDRMAGEFSTAAGISSTLIDDLLPEDIALQIHAAFPSSDQMTLKRSIKEYKHVAAQMNAYDPLLEEAVYAFQEPEVVGIVGKITGLSALEPDADLYAGGISLMNRGGYLRPHLDNSHDGQQRRFRALNLLYYVTPDWRIDFGGNLQLWDDGPLTQARTIESRFNRLVLMVTNTRSWHSVNEVTHDGAKCCVSNYYFSNVSPERDTYFHATSFRGETGGLGDIVMQADNLTRTTILKILPGSYSNPHVYKRGK